MVGHPDLLDRDPNGGGTQPEPDHPVARLGILGRRERQRVDGGQVQASHRGDPRGLDGRSFGRASPQQGEEDVTAVGGADDVGHVVSVDEPVRQSPRQDHHVAGESVAAQVAALPGRQGTKVGEGGGHRPPGDRAAHVVAAVGADQIERFGEWFRRGPLGRCHPRQVTVMPADRSGGGVDDGPPAGALIRRTAARATDEQRPGPGGTGPRHDATTRDGIDGGVLECPAGPRPRVLDQQPLLGGCGGAEQ